RAPALLHAQPAPCAHEGSDPPERLALRLRRQLERCRDVRQLPPQEARRRRPAADQDRAPGGLHARIRAGMKRLSLRARLVLGVLVLGAAGLLVADAFTYTSLRSFLLDRVDKTLAADHQGAEHAGPGGFDRGGTGSDFVQIRSSTGEVLFTSDVPHFPGTEAPSPPSLPATISVPATPSGSSPDRVSYLTVQSQSGDERYRVRASIDPNSSNLLIIATTLSGVDG